MDSIEDEGDWPVSPGAWWLIGQYPQERERKRDDDDNEAAEKEGTPE